MSSWKLVKRSPCQSELDWKDWSWCEGIGWECESGSDEKNNYKIWMINWSIRIDIDHINKAKFIKTWLKFGWGDMDGWI